MANGSWIVCDLSNDVTECESIELIKMAKSVVVLGTQWGDEGKGKIVDLLTDQAAVVVRFRA